jgi:DNA-binding XRE family transcriptional regulator
MSSIVYLMTATKRHSTKSSPAKGGQSSRVKNLRVELGLTRVQLAKLADLSEKTVDRVERGNQVFRETTYRKVFNALNKARAKEGMAALVYQKLFQRQHGGEAHKS